MVDTKHIVNILIGVLVIAGFGLAAFTLLDRKETEESQNTKVEVPGFSSTERGEGKLSSEQIDILVQKISRVSLDTDFLVSQSFLRLQDYNVEPDPEPVGIANPFINTSF